MKFELCKGLSQQITCYKIVRIWVWSSSPISKVRHSGVLYNPSLQKADNRHLGHPRWPVYIIRYFLGSRIHSHSKNKKMSNWRRHSVAFIALNNTCSHRFPLTQIYIYTPYTQKNRESKGRGGERERESLDVTTEAQFIHIFIVTWLGEGLKLKYRYEWYNQTEMRMLIVPY